MTDALTITSGSQASFTLVISEITVAGDLRAVPVGGKAKNLLAAPKAVNVILSK